MKKIILMSLVALCLTGCTIFRPPVIILSSTVDYSEYQKEGFFLSESNSVNFSYEPLASVAAIQLSGYAIKKSGEQDIMDDAYQTGHKEVFTTTTGKYINASRSDVLKQLVKEAKNKGANAIINLEIKPVMGTTKEGYVYLQGYSSTGMAIKK